MSVHRRQAAQDLANRTGGPWALVTIGRRRDDDDMTVTLIAERPHHRPALDVGRWRVQLAFTPQGRNRLHADAILTAGADHLVGRGDTRKHPSDPDVPTVAAQVAASRALADLAAQLDEIAQVQFRSWEDRDFVVLPLG